MIDCVAYIVLNYVAETMLTGGSSSCRTASLIG